MTQRHQTIITAIQELLSSKASKAIMLATLNDITLQLSAKGKPKRVRELVPPDDWFESGKLEWLTQDGALLGLIWSPTETGLEQTTLELLTWLLTAARSNEGKRVLNVLMTQLPEGVAWLSEHLTFEQVSRQFLELHGCQASAVVGRSFAEVFAHRPELASLLEQGVLGYSAELSAELLSINGEPRWLRSRIRPYFSDEGAGVLWTVQDVSAELLSSAGVSALLNAASGLTALVSGEGKLIQAGQTLQDLSAQRTQQPLVDGQHISDWALWEGHLSRAAWATLLKQAASEPLEQTIKLSTQERLRVNIRRSADSELTNAAPVTPQESRDNDRASQPHTAPPIYIVTVAVAGGTPEYSQLLNTFIQSSPHPLLLLGPEEEKRGRPLLMLSQTAIQLLGLDKTPKAGHYLDDLLAQQNIWFTHAEGTPTTLTQLYQQSLRQHLLNQNLPESQASVEAVLHRPDGSRRNIELRAAVMQDTSTVRALAPSSRLRAKSPVPAQRSANVAQTAHLPLSVYLEDVTSKRNLTERLQHNARHDALTGLPNWQGLSSAHGQQPAPYSDTPGAGLKSAPRTKSRGKKASTEEYCLLIIAIDDFAALQALLGRTTSDHLLIQMAARLHQWRKEGRAARLEGAQFALLLPCTEAQLPKAMQELQQILSQPMRAGGREIHLSVSIGVSSATSGLDKQLEEAQSALHAAQNNGTGRGQVEFYSPVVRQRDADLLQLEQEMHQALPAQFTLLLQPIVSLETGRVRGVELLLRWQHPMRGNINPRVFLPLLSRTEMLPVLGEWLLDEASQLRRRWQSIYPHLRLHLNVSGEELRNPGYLAHLHKELQEGSRLSLEISAAGLLQEQDRQSTVLQDLRQQGCEVYIDDFGNGSATLTTLEKFALSGVKLHPSFVANLQEGSRQLSVLEGTVELIRRLDLQLIAVGVENAAQSELLARTGCQAAQGYLYLPPRPLSEFENWMSTQVASP